MAQDDWCLDWVPKEKPAGTRKKEKAPTRAILPTDTYTEQHRELAKQLGMDVARQYADFRSSAKAHGRRYVDWDAAFRNWLTSPLQQKGKL